MASEEDKNTSVLTASVLQKATPEASQPTGIASGEIALPEAALEQNEPIRKVSELAIASGAAAATGATLEATGSRLAKAAETAFPISASTEAAAISIEITPDGNNLESASIK